MYDAQDRQDFVQQYLLDLNIHIPWVKSDYALVALTRKYFKEKKLCVEGMSVYACEHNMQAMPQKSCKNIAKQKNYNA